MPTPPGVADFHAQGAASTGDWETDKADERWVATHCSFCGVQCGMYPRVADEGVIGVEPRMDTHNRGKLCPKGVAAYQQMEHPDRLTYPLVREGGRLRRASWDEAMDRVVTGIRRIQDDYGPHAMATYGGASMTTEKTYLLGKFARSASARSTPTTTAACAWCQRAPPTTPHSTSTARRIPSATSPRPTWPS